MKSVKTFTATIYVGQREQYSQEVRSIDMAFEWLRQYADKGGVCFTLTPIQFIYKNGWESGFSVGLINYPRFPESEESIKAKAIEVATGLKDLFKQLKVSVVFPDQTVMIDSE